LDGNSKVFDVVSFVEAVVSKLADVELVALVSLILVVAQLIEGTWSSVGRRSDYFLFL